MELIVGDETRDLNSDAVIYDNEPDFLLSYCDVYFDRPVPGLCLFLYEQPTMLFDFLDEMENEMAFWHVPTCTVFSVVPLEMYNLFYVGVAKDANFGPYHTYRYAP